MKLLPIPLPPLGAPPTLGMWNSDFLWRYPAPPSPLAELKTQLPPQLSHDPRVWGRDDVAIFLQFCEREFDLPKFELDLFKMNGKALCLLTKTDLAERIPGAGDVLHNVLQMLVRESQMLHKDLPNSPVTPTSRYHPFSPYSQPPTPNWSALAPPDNPFHPAHIQHLMQSNSVTLSPAPSIDSQGRSPPQHPDPNQVAFVQTNSSSSNQSDSDEDSYSDKPQQLLQGLQHGSPPLTPLIKDAPISLSQQISNVVNSWSIKNENGNGINGTNMSSNGAGSSSSGSSSAPSTPGAFAPVKREFFPDTPEPNTNGRLLWDFLQQLLNDPAQRYNNFIMWKCRDTGVFKIVDPAGLAKLWGIQKNHLSMNYDKMSRALRYYYRVNILRKVQGERHCYQFLRNPTELKSIKNISLLRQQAAPPQSPNSVNGSVTGSNNNGPNSSTNHSSQQIPQGKSESNYAYNAMALFGLNHLTLPGSNSAGSSNTQSLSHLTSHHHPHHHQQPPSSPRVHALNGAFHQLSTSSPTLTSAPVSFNNGSVVPQSQTSPAVSVDFKCEPNMEVEDMPTDLSTGGERKYANSNSSTHQDYYPLLRNSNGLSIRVICHNRESPSPEQTKSPMSPQQSQSHHQPMDEYSSVSPSSNNHDHHTNIKSESSSGSMATDLRKAE